MALDDSLREALSTFLRPPGAAPADRVIRLGRDEGPAGALQPDADRRQRLLDDIASAQRGSRTMIGLWVFLILGIFVLAAGFAVYYRDDQKFVAGSILGGSGIMALLLHQARGAHLRQLSSQILLALLPNLPPDQWTKVAMVFAEQLVKQTN